MAATPAWSNQDKDGGWSTDVWKGGLFHVTTNLGKSKNMCTILYQPSNFKKILNSIRTRVLLQSGSPTLPNEKQDRKH